MSKKRDLKNLRAPQPEVKAATPPNPQTRGKPRVPVVEWDEKEDGPRPTHFLLRNLNLIPCPNCNAKKFKHNGARAVIPNGTHAPKVNLKCQACGHTFALPAKRIDPDPVS